MDSTGEVPYTRPGYTPAAHTAVLSTAWAPPGPSLPR